MAFFLFEFFKNLFNSLKKQYNKLSDEQKGALQAGTGLVQIINDHLEETPAVVLQKIQAQFPDIDVVKLQEALFSVAQSFKITDLNNIEEAIAAIQAHLNSLDGKVWAVASHAAASLLSVLFSPPETKVSTVVLLIEWVYQHFIKKATDKKI